MKPRLTLSEEEERYFRAAACIRQIPVTTLLNKVMAAIAKDYMIASILDDEDELKPFVNKKIWYPRCRLPA